MYMCRPHVKSDGLYSFNLSYAHNPLHFPPLSSVICGQEAVISTKIYHYQGTASVGVSLTLAVREAFGSSWRPRLVEDGAQLAFGRSGLSIICRAHASWERPNRKPVISAVTYERPRASLRHCARGRGRETHWAAL